MMLRPIGALVRLGVCQPGRRLWRAAEQKWYSLTGRVVDPRAEEDGDLHIALANVNGDKPKLETTRHSRHRLPPGPIPAQLVKFS
jgi:hypothetical protein